MMHCKARSIEPELQEMYTDEREPQIVDTAARDCHAVPSPSPTRFSMPAPLRLPLVMALPFPSAAALRLRSDPLPLSNF